MSSWAARAKAAISQTGQGGTAILEKPADWHALDAAYLSHHFNCPACIAAGRGSRYGLRCDTGAALWCAYAQADQPGGKNCELTQNED